MKVFLGVYVDDFHMAGKTENLPIMWQRLRKHLDLDPPKPFDGITYLGCTQVDVPVNEAMVKEKAEIFGSIIQTVKNTTADDDASQRDKAKTCSEGEPCAPKTS